MLLQSCPKNVFVTLKLVIETFLTDFQKRTNIRNAIKVYDENTCIRFIEYSGQQDYLNIVGTGGCSSYVGRVGGGQQVIMLWQCDYKQATAFEGPLWRIHIPAQDLFSITNSYE